MNIEIRTEESKDINPIFELNRLSFGSADEAKLVNNLRDLNSLTLSLVAILDGKVVGHIAYSPMKISNFDELKLFGLAPMAVHPKLQKQGIGSKLINESLIMVKDLGVDAVFLLGHQDYYPKFGFKPSYSTFGIKSKYEVPDEVFMAIELNTNILGNVTGLATYSKAFDGL